jgi:hypothetical protein
VEVREDEMSSIAGFEGIVGQSSALREVGTAEKSAPPKSRWSGSAGARSSISVTIRGKAARAAPTTARCAHK